LRPFRAEAGLTVSTADVTRVTGDGTPLGGGRWTAGVVRVGDTVRRPGTEFTATLLTHLEANGFDGGPRHLGWDDQGRQILSFLPGDVPPKWQRFTDDQVAAAAALLRRFHDAGRDLAATLGGEVICHHDPGPNNTVFRDGHPVALIDVDFAAAGSALDDVAYLAWSWCISSRPDRGPAGFQAGQVRVLADAYGLTAADRARLPAAIESRFARNELVWQDVLDGTRTSTSDPAHVAEVLRWTRREAAYFATARSEFADVASGAVTRREWGCRSGPGCRPDRRG
jgi:Phosphotransferase enzyme family